jgi:hypothetical protein
MSIRIDKIYVDMDGVIADFYKRYQEMFNISPDDGRYKKQFSGNFPKFIETQQFATLDLMPDARDLINFLDNQVITKEILSSTARPENDAAISMQKARWLATHNIIYKTNFVPGKQHKYKFATPNSIIIDDTKSVIDDWNKAGGIGILHTDAISTISKLKMYI